MLINNIFEVFSVSGKHTDEFLVTHIVKILDLGYFKTYLLIHFALVFLVNAAISG